MERLRNTPLHPSAAHFIFPRDTPKSYCITPPPDQKDVPVEDAFDETEDSELQEELGVELAELDNAPESVKRGVDVIKNALEDTRRTVPASIA